METDQPPPAEAPVVDEDPVDHSAITNQVDSSSVEPKSEPAGSGDHNHENDVTNHQNDDLSVVSTRRSLRAKDSDNRAAVETVAKQEKKPAAAVKRKSTGGGDTPQRSKLPRFESTPVRLEAKTIVLGGSDSHNYVLDRNKLITIPPKEGDYEVGDLIWAKMQGYPWWPCMVTIDPVTGAYSKISGASYKADRVYHVQYFGSQPYRGWTMISMTMPFEGFQPFSQKAEQELKDLEKSRKKSRVEAKYAVKPSIAKKWNESISEAEEAMKLDKKERLRRLNFHYSVGNQNALVKISKLKGTSGGGSQRSSSGGSRTGRASLNNSSIGGKKSSEDVYDFDEDEDDGFDNGPLPGFVFRKRLPKGDFNVFVKRHLDEEVKKNPDLSKSEMTKKLREKWNELDEEMRSIYVERKAIYEDECNMLVAKRSNFDDDYFNESDNDYYQSDSDHNGFDDKSSGDAVDDKNCSREAPPAAGSKSARKSKSKSKKSEKLFDKIKKEGDTSASQKETEETAPPATDPPLSTPSSSKKPRKSRKTANEEKETPAAAPETEQPADAAQDKPAANQQGKSDASDKPAKAARKSGTGVIKNRLCIGTGLEESDDAHSMTSESSSLDEFKSKKGGGTEERFCHQCGDDYKKDDQLVFCTGECGRMYHLKCDKDTKMILVKDDNYLCQDCHTGKHKCFACRNPDDLDTKKCENASCNRFYHLSCIAHHPVRVNELANTFLCPQHKCVNCHLLSLDDNEYRDNRRKLVKCIRCPIAYHKQEVCIGAGTVLISKDYIICPEHYDEYNNNRNNRHINVNYCFGCVKSGNLICCEKCPVAFHEECLDYNFDHEKSFYCSDCLNHKHLHYGDIVWVKLGQYRWWPGRICHPNIVPDNVMNLSHSYGDFPVYFFGSHDYYWVNQGRTFLFVEEDNKFLTSNMANKSSGGKLKNAFKLALKEVAEAFEEWKRTSSEKTSLTINNKPLPYQHINSNKYCTKNAAANSSPHESSIHVCDCTDKMENPCSDDNCLNRISLIECDPKHCPAGDKCQNQRFRKCEYVKCKPFRTKSAGWGLMALEDIKEGQFVIEYCGEVIDEKECEKRLKKISSIQANFYFLTLDKDNIIDAGPKGNLSRFLNHSCEPNCITQKWVVNNFNRIGLFALKDIPAGSELTFNYNLDCRGNEQIECKCNSSKCSGYIGSRPKSDNDTATGAAPKRGISNGSNGKLAGPAKINGKAKQQTNSKKSCDNVCFQCGEAAGQLVGCHEPGCTKSYHLACLNEPTTAVPPDWACPRHTCMRKPCPEPVFLSCSVCPNSFCKQHAAAMSDDLQLPDDRFLCGDHRSSDDEGLIMEEAGASGGVPRNPST